MYPIHILREKTELPKEGIYYVVAANGIFLHKDTGLVEAFVPVSAISFLPELSPWARHHFPKIPAEFLARFVGFARDVFQRFQSEAVVLLYYSLTEKKYALVCPEQSSVSVKVKYRRDIPLTRFRQVGTIHSHPDFNAYHSSIDEADENGFDGLHITVGNIDQPCFSVSCELAINGSRFKLKPDEIIEGIESVDVGTAQCAVRSAGQLNVRTGRDLSLREQIADESLPAPVSMDLNDLFQLVLSAETEKQEPDIKSKAERRFQFVGTGHRLVLPTHDNDYPKDWLDKVNGWKGGKENGSGTLVKTGSDERKGRGHRRYRLLSFALFGKIFTVSIQEREAS
ncbi:hypothetical protein HZB94_03230 [Candidatus Falkowbacteria bacterium]|nr:hypothetical protein [Candidatus Falkowbacteria bacterium]